MSPTVIPVPPSWEVLSDLLESHGHHRLVVSQELGRDFWRACRLPDPHARAVTQLAWRECPFGEHMLPPELVVSLPSTTAAILLELLDSLVSFVPEPDWEWDLRAGIHQVVDQLASAVRGGERLDPQSLLIYRSGIQQRINQRPWEEVPESLITETLWKYPTAEVLGQVYDSTCRAILWTLNFLLEEPTAYMASHAIRREHCPRIALMHIRRARSPLAWLFLGGKAVNVANVPRGDLESLRRNWNVLDQHARIAQLEGTDEDKKRVAVEALYATDWLARREMAQFIAQVLDHPDSTPWPYEVCLAGLDFHTRQRELYRTKEGLPI